MKKSFLVIGVLGLLLSACQPALMAPEAEEEVQAAAPIVAPSATPAEVEQETATTVAPTLAPPPQSTPTATQAVTGPDTYPDGINPLTGLSVSNPAYLGLPPALISITNFPASARPQAGLGSSSMVFEMYVGEGMSRFLALFYGEFPSSGSSSADSVTALGDTVWNDANENGMQDAGEYVVDGIGVNLIDSAGNIVSSATTDINGRYLFSGIAAGEYSLEFIIPSDMQFAPMDQGGNDGFDSDVDPNTGKTAPVIVQDGITNLSVDAGLLGGAAEGQTLQEATATPEIFVPTPAVTVPEAEASIGPIRSGRIAYESVRELFNGFLIMASASANVRSNLSSYTNIFGSDTDDINSAMIKTSQIEQIAQQNQGALGVDALGGNVFDANPPEGCQTANRVWLRYSLLNQINWRYNTADGSYHRFQNDTVTGTDFTEQVDRLTGNALTYENVVVLFADHHAQAETLINIDLIGVTRPALLFRDGCMYEINWTTMAGDYERETGMRRPMRYVDQDGNPFPLKPGQTWVMIVPMYTPYYETPDTEDVLQLIRAREQGLSGTGNWGVLFSPPAIER